MGFAGFLGLKKSSKMAVFGLGGVEVRSLGKYEVGSDGSVWRNGSRLAVDRGLYVSVSEGGKVSKVRVAYLVARAFLPNSEMRPYVRHKDGDPRNNRMENLEWSEKPEELRGRRSVKEPVTVWLRENGMFVGGWPSVREACQALKVGEGSARRVLRGEAKSAKGYIFKY